MTTQLGDVTGATPGADVLLEDVVKRYRVGRDSDLMATDHISLHIQAGSAVALVGASGSGKSTLLHLMGAMDTADTGRVIVDQVDLATLDRRRLSSYRRGVGFVFQRFHLLPALTVQDNVLAPLLPYRTSFDRQARAQELIDAVGLTGREHALPSRLSGGQQQRVAIARALVNRPRLLLADEPTGNLDTATGATILELLFDLQAATGTTIVLATHDPQVAAHCHRIIRLRDGAVRDDLALDPTSAPDPDLLEQISGLNQR